jgi:aldehyde:ferredoxin oxidoreductase
MMDRFYGYAGKLLRVDLTKEKISDEKLDPETARKYLGGTGLGAKYLYDEVPAGIRWDDEENRIILATGPLGGTRVAGSGTFSVVTKGPLTNGATATQANGFLGAYLKFSGYDGLIIQGRAKRWLYLYVHDKGAELRSADHLVGKDTYETEDLIKSELGKRKREMSVACIGVSGENLVKFAAITADKGHVASHNGPGAVMGSKRLKAIAVDRGDDRPVLVDSERITAIARQFHNNILEDPRMRAGLYSYGTLNILTGTMAAGTGHVPVKNFTTNVFDIPPDKLEKFSGPYIRDHFEPKPRPCWACAMKHCHRITLTEGPFKGETVEEPEYEGLAAFGPQIGVTDVTVAIYLSNLVDRLGMDNNEACWALGLAIECFEKGLLTSKDTDGIELTWGNYKAASQMLEHMATREGFGDILAEGAMRAAQSIGGEAPNFAIHTMKGNTPRVIDQRNRWPWLFDTCLSQMSSDEGYMMQQPSDLGLSVHLDLVSVNNSPEDTVAWNALCKGACQFDDCLGVCRFTTRTNLKLLAEAICAATGWDFAIEETMEVGMRIVNLLRVFNLRHGHTAEMDAPSPRFGSAPVDGPSEGKSILPHWNEMRRKYYEEIGWDGDTGHPTEETLKRYGLDHTIPELREIQSASVKV